MLDTIIRVISAGNDAPASSDQPSQPAHRPPMTKWDPSTFDPSRASPVMPGDFHMDALLRNSSAAAGRAPTGAADQARAEWNKQLLTVAGRRWREGDLYTPRDLGPKEAAKWSFAVPKSRIDPFKMMGRNPLSFYKVCSVDLSRTWLIVPELLGDRRVQAVIWQDHGQEEDGADAQEPANYGQDGTAGDRHWVDPE
jgi:hypothetical protein